MGFDVKLWRPEGQVCKIFSRRRVKVWEQFWNPFSRSSGQTIIKMLIWIFTLWALVFSTPYLSITVYTLYYKSFTVEWNISMIYVVEFSLAKVISSCNGHTWEHISMKIIYNFVTTMKPKRDYEILTNSITKYIN